jgi:hypothetical protein
MQDEITNLHKFRASSHSLRIFGTCHECQLQETNANPS